MLAERQTQASSVDRERLQRNPETIPEISNREMFALSIDEQNDIRLGALQRRFELLKDRIPVLSKLAREQGVDRITDFADGAPLLFPHTMYKSYPLSFFEKAQFDRLTKWLGNLTTCDLSHIDAKGCDSIDDWIDLLDRETSLRVVHTGGTTGKLSFIPRSEDEARIWASITWRRGFDGFGDEPDRASGDLSEYELITPSYRTGAYGTHRQNGAFIKYVFGGDESRLHALYPGRMSADIMSLGGRLQAAEAKGELGRLQISKTLMERREKFLREQQEAPARMKAFFQQLATDLKGRRVILPSTWAILIDIAEEGLRQGISGVFAPDSMVMLGGGKKGRVLPEGYKETVLRFLGIENHREGFSMNEMIAFNSECAHGHFHLMPWLVPYLLDPKTGVPFARTGTVKGRLGFIDLIPTSYWGGFLSGDEVTLSWGDTEPCPCGRKGTYLHKDIRRYSEAEGGDDKITCAGTPDAHDKALDFISKMSE